MITIDSDKTLEIYLCKQGLISLKQPSEILEMMKIFQVECLRTSPQYYFLGSQKIVRLGRKMGVVLFLGPEKRILSARADDTKSVSKMM